MGYRFIPFVFLLLFASSVHAQRPTRQRTSVTYEDPLALREKYRTYSAPFAEERKWWQNFYPDAYTLERQKIQDKIIETLLPAGSSSENPWVILMAGGFGSGKTMASREIERVFPEDVRFGQVDADQYREAIPEFSEFKKSDPKWAGDLVQQEATYLADLGAMRGLSQNQNLIIDSSLKDYTASEKIVAWIKKHHPRYHILIAYVKRDKEQVLRSVRQRALETGRDIPVEKVEASIIDSRETVKRLVSEVDHVLVINNDGNKFQIEEILKSDGKTNLHWPLSRTNLKKTLELSTKRNPKRVIFREVSDIDWTIVSPLEHSSEFPAHQDWQVVTAGGQQYRVSDYLDEMIQIFLKDPELRLSFWSKGEKSRNIELLKGIHPPALKGKSLYDFAEFVLSKEDLNAAGEKELKKISDDVSHLFLIDDQAKNIKGSGEKGVLLPQTYNFYDTYAQAEMARDDAVQKHLSQEFIPGSFDEWIRDRDRLLGVLEVTVHSKEEMLHSSSKLKGSKLHFGEIAENYSKTNWTILNQKGFEIISSLPSIDFDCDRKMAGE